MAVEACETIDLPAVTVEQAGEVARLRAELDEAVAWAVAAMERAMCLHRVCHLVEGELFEAVQMVERLQRRRVEVVGAAYVAGQRIGGNVWSAADGVLVPR